MSSIAAPNHAAGDIQSLPTPELVTLLERLNDAYRRGEPLVSDHDYDHVYLAELRQREPDHPFLNTVEAEPEDAFSGSKVRHPFQMMSTEKAYEDEAVASWLRRGVSAAAELGVEVSVEVTPKLDGIAGRWDGSVLATRGDGFVGADVTRNFDRGVVNESGSDPDVGEIVVHQPYFEAHLSGTFKHPRNFVAGLIGADTLQPVQVEALNAGAIRFVPYSKGPSATVSVAEFEARWSELLAESREQVEYATDGAVARFVCPSATDTARLHEALGATGHHHRAYIALKIKGETARTVVESVTLQTGRLGRVTPVLNIDPVHLSGATIRNVTAHTGRHVEKLQLGPGAEVEIVRSGEVIPYLSLVRRPSPTPLNINDAHCPSCDSDLDWDGDYLVCPNHLGCPAQLSGRLEHWFRTLGVLGFGPAVCDKLAASGITSGVKALQMTSDEFVSVGISPGIARNLEAAVETRKAEGVRDAMLLAALGIRHLGRGDSRRILECHALESVGQLTRQDLESINGFGPLTSSGIVGALGARWGEVEEFLALGFSIMRTPIKGAAASVDSPIAGKKIVFTGKSVMPRSDMQDQARALGAEVQSSVSKATDMLVCGENVGASKMAKAEKLGVQIMMEADYLALIQA